MKELGWELYEDFKQEYVKKISYKLSRRHNIPIEDVEWIVKRVFSHVEEENKDSVKSAYKKAFVKVFSLYLLDYLDLDFQDTAIYLESDLGRKPSEKELEELRKELIYEVISDPRALETLYELWGIYYSELYNELKDLLKEIEQKADQDVVMFDRLAEEDNLPPGL